MSDEQKQGYPDYFQRSQFPTQGYKQYEEFTEYNYNGEGSLIIKEFANNSIIENFELNLRDAPDAIIFFLELYLFDGVQTYSQYFTYEEILSANPYYDEDLFFNLKAISPSKNSVKINTIYPIQMFPNSKIQIAIEGAVNTDILARGFYKELEK